MVCTCSVYGTVLCEKHKPDKTQVSRYQLCTCGLGVEARASAAVGQGHMGTAGRGTITFPVHVCAVGCYSDWGPL